METSKTLLLNSSMSMYGTMVKELCFLYLYNHANFVDYAAQTVFVCAWNELHRIPDVSFDKEWLQCLAIDVCHAYVLGIRVCTNQKLQHWDLPDSIVYKYFRVKRNLKNWINRLFVKADTNNKYNRPNPSDDALRSILEVSQNRMRATVCWTSANTKEVQSRIIPT